ncbi:AAA family ATPase [Fodinibius sp.]|uniref:AAA family ATPase n=1 Tax=Fodinibius sp. TaxID=1872440 RepID=UPI002ACD239F|nr:AAA family ATPase [Fodinibius sp.]MDZ7657778.1 AAA family ATPase [Fodinibius sp.]
MDKSIISAVAGSGKTTHIIKNLDLEKNYLVITYTINNYRNLKHEIAKKFDHLPENIDLYTYFPFLYAFCFNPFLGYKIKPRGITYDYPPPSKRYTKANQIEYYVSKNRRLYHNRIARLLEELDVLEDINRRIEKYYDALYIDEIQDFAGHDFNLLKSILTTDLEVKLVGDFYQHTFDTSRDGNTNKNLHQDYGEYLKEFEALGVEVNEDELEKSWRCSPTVCGFINNQLGIQIESHKQDSTLVEYIETAEEIEDLYQDDQIVKLFYQEHYKYDCYSRNWGDCKGENQYENVCVVLNQKTERFYKKGKLEKLSPVTKNKLYVACSRSHNDLYFISEEKIKHHKRG